LARYFWARSRKLAHLEEHLLWCASCVERAEETQDYVDAMRVAAYDDYHEGAFRLVNVGAPRQNNQPATTTTTSTARGDRPCYPQKSL